MTDWFEDPDDDGRASTKSESWMRLYITAALIGMGVLGVIGTMLHIFPA
ncbi:MULTISPECIES: hypothetical protein [unclassified Methylobacterium]|nr:MULTISPECIES: hypothetical protein [unclassified Methylobacterium]MCJ2144398.1 hypothetical protein [Methylobacterium sp. E-066]